MPRTVFIPLHSISGGPVRGPTKAERRAEERAAATRRAELDQAMADCLAALVQNLVNKRHKKHRRYGR